MTCDYCSKDQLRKSLHWSEYFWGGRTDMIDVEWFPEGKLTVIADIDNNSEERSFDIKYCPICGRKLSESTYDKDSLEKLALEVREVIYAIYPEYYEKYTGEMLHSPEYVFDIAELICKEKEESE